MVSEDKRISVAHADRVGKVFVAMAHGRRKCLVCDEVFTRRAAADHATTPCYPELEAGNDGDR
jgi:hypothetical protein